ncbi:endonuclease-8 [Haloactinopolyspora alba]|uniref:DNA-(apurinic or apyrimidinic site) lyase n=1 Tax=Haloactinopolyspora alba TaxID=648780 RepID=A0A2P8EBA9_9ACTN|nr:DNA-formamidopyrimidine glycosylase family protein [Haloactinopolyspora alba]PSL06738.1 endonuclease-8 [Haloactinopolyspora alba]
MPEGHTIHRLARSLRAVFAGEPVSVTSPQGRFADGAAVVDGVPLRATDAHGKHLFLGFEDDRWVHVHLGLYGRFDIVEQPPGPPRGAVRMRMAAPSAHADLRGPTACEVLDESVKASIGARLGPDPLRGDDPEPALRRIGGSRSPIGVLLMDQSVVAGVGNVYRAEVLFRAGIDPARPGRSVPGDVLHGIWTDLVGLMTAGERTGRIDTVRPEHEPEAMGREPRVDDHGGEVYVYRRGGRPCHVCATPVASGTAAARNTFWCPHCQR